MRNDIILYTTIDGKIKVELYELGDSVYMTQELIAKLFDTSKQNISLHIQNIFEDKELSEFSVVKENLTTATDGKQYKVKFYSLEMILAIGFRVRSKRGVQFRKWANKNLQTYLQKGFIIDSDRLKEPSGRTDYFDELLERIRDIRASEKRFYQKIKDLFALCVDYDSDDKATQMFFANTQNKFLYAITGQTAAEIISCRADANKPNMGLFSFKGSVIRKGDVVIAKNYLDENELDSLNRLVNVFLESAELRVKQNLTLTMEFWKNNVDRLIEFQGHEILDGNGQISNEQMKMIAYEHYETFDRKRKQEARLKADELELKELSKKLKDK